MGKKKNIREMLPPPPPPEKKSLEPPEEPLPTVAKEAEPKKEELFNHKKLPSLKEIYKIDEMTRETVSGQEKEAQFKYRLDRFKDDATGQIKYKLNKVYMDNGTQPPGDDATTASVKNKINPDAEAAQEIPPVDPNIKYKLDKIIQDDGTTKYRLNKIESDTPDLPPAPRDKIIIQDDGAAIEPEVAPRPPAIVKDVQYKLDKIIQDDGTTKYKLNKIDAEAEPPEPRLDDEEDTTITERNLDSIENQQFVISQKFFLEKPPINVNILLGANERIEKAISMKEIVENSVYLNSMNLLNYINIKIVSNNPESIYCKLILLYVSMNDKQLKKIGEFNLGEIKKKSGKVYTKILNCQTPKNGCFLISMIKISVERPLNEVIYLDYDIYTTKKKIPKEKIMNITDMNQIIDYVQ